MPDQPVSQSVPPGRCSEIVWDMRDEHYGEHDFYAVDVGDLIWNLKGGHGHLIVAEQPPSVLRRVRLKWEPRDLWIGCYWTRDPMIRIYFYFVPCLVLVFEERESPRRGRRGGSHG